MDDNNAPADVSRRRHDKKTPSMPEEARTLEQFLADDSDSDRWTPEFRAWMEARRDRQ